MRAVAEVAVVLSPAEMSHQPHKTHYAASCHTSCTVLCFAEPTSQMHLHHPIATVELYAFRVKLLMSGFVLLLLLLLLFLQVSVGGVTSVSLPGLVGLGPLVTLQQVEVGPGPAEKSFLQASVLCRAVPG